MLLLQKVFLFSLLALLFPQNTTTPKQELNDQLYEAVRKGDAAAVASLLDRGADVNAKFRYGATAMTWALDNKHVEVVRLLLQKSAEDVDDVLMTGTRESNAELVKIALDRGGVKPETLTAALAVSEGDEKNAAIVEMLKKAGATPPHQVDAATLQSYSGKYKGEPGPEFTIVVKEGKLFLAGVARSEQPLMAIDNTTFRPLNFGGITLAFNVEAGKVTGVAFKQGQNTTQMKRIE